MASPQKENGFVPIANEITEKFAQINLSAYEWRVLWVILRKTYGWNKPDDWISVSQMEELTKLDRRHVSRAKKKLIQKNIIFYRGDKVVFNKDYDKWVSPKQAIGGIAQIGDTAIASIGKGVSPKRVIRVSPKQAHTINIPYKRHYTKDTISDISVGKTMNEIWEYYKTLRKWGKVADVNYNRNARNLKKISKIVKLDGLEKVKEGMIVLKNYYEDKNFEWTLETFIRWYADWKANPDKYSEKTTEDLLREGGYEK